MDPLDYVAFIESCYRVEQPEADWLRGIAIAASPLMGFGQGVHVYTVDLDAHTMADPMLVDGRPEWEASWREQWWDAFMTQLDAATLRLIHTVSAVNFTSELWAAAAARSSVFEAQVLGVAPRSYSDARARFKSGRFEGAPSWGPSGFRYPDSFNVSGIDATGRGVVLIANMPDVANGSVQPNEVGLWSRLGAHAAAGYRLMRALRQPAGELAGVDAVVEPNGKLAHVDQSLRDGIAIDALRERVVAVDRARAQQRHDPRAATEVWTGLTEGRWSLVDRFDRDGRRFYLARANTPQLEQATATLSAREEQVARAASLGHSNKLIAYELGISLSTVATHLKSAATKLGVGSRLELIRALRVRSGPS